MTVHQRHENRDEKLDTSGAEVVGLIGIGLMGTAIAGRLVQGNFRVCGWDIDSARRQALAQHGGEAATGPGEVVARCRRIILSLPTHEVVAEFLEQTCDAFRAGQVIIDTSTGDPQAAIDQAERLSARQIDYLDATVSGSSTQLAQGTAVLMVGADEQAYRRNDDILAALGEKRYHTGPPGSGARMKLVTNLVLGLNRAALAEGLYYANLLELNSQQVLTLLKESMAYSRIMETKGEKMRTGDFTPQARLSQHLKDVRLIQASVPSGDERLPLTKTHRELLERAERLGWGDFDNSAILKAFEPDDKSHSAPVDNEPKR